ncbi:hypothetical protein ABID82_006543 [Methylobacterium sp. PvP062]|uniref:FAD dependent oxidoreductase n=1 Tax=Methylobacterium radiotolerans TaxID=31998 RepID=A0ABV2NTV0_9HYPH|nr:MULTISPECIES: hypothetical protein [unclassified Methylobacterium]MBP2498972.1 hypothetical protein [Methylobacterium sp. PvP105]MBP2505529.1 hypothetical protein [Methylobacterium sp. PvP109]
MTSGSAHVTGKQRKGFHIHVVGGGVAGTGFLVCAARNRVLQRWLASGIFLSEQSPDIGGGSLLRYGNVKSISQAGGFIKAFESPEVEKYLPDVLMTPYAEYLKGRRNEEVNLDFAGKFLGVVGSRMRALIDSEANSKALTGVEAVSIRQTLDERLVVRLAPRCGSAFEVQSNYVVMNLGAHQSLSEIAGEQFAGIFELKSFLSKIILSECILNGDKSSTDRCSQALRQGRGVTILGGGHSAWACAVSLLEICDSLSIPQSAVGIIRLVQKGPLKLFYPDAASALEDGYVFDLAADVCPVSRQVNRYSGLRAHTFDLARRILADEGEQERRLSFVAVDGEQHSSRVRQLVHDSAYLIPAFGYKPNIIPYIDARGNRTEFLCDRHGLITDEQCQVLTRSGLPIKGLYSFGIGAGMRSSPDVGGEASFNGRIIGVWQFHHSMGDVVVQSILAADAQS